MRTVARPPAAASAGCPCRLTPCGAQGLRASPFWSSAELPWCAELEANAHVICEELAQLERNAQAPWGAVGGRAAHDGSLVSSGTWSEFLLLGAGAASNAALCPRTTALLQRITAATSLARCGVGEALFSALAPGTRLRPHCGATNSRLTCHLGLRVPADCGLRVGDETRGWEAGKCTVFDDSFEHEAWNEGDAVRVVLLINFWHPDIPPSDWRPLQTPAAAGV
jgi:aspartate beta-hydroxylase